MTSLVKGEVDDMENAFTGSVGSNGGKDEFPAPKKEDEQENGPCYEVSKAYVQRYQEEDVF